MKNVSVYAVTLQFDDITLDRLKDPEDGFGLAVMESDNGLTACVENCRLDEFLLMPDELKRCVADTIWNDCSWFRIAGR